MKRGEEAMRPGFRITRRAAFVGAAAVGGVLGAPAVLRAQGPVRLTLGHGQSPGNPRSVAADRMAAQLRERSDGRVELRVAGSEQLGSDVAMLTGLRTGTLDMSVNSQGPVSSVVPELAAFGLPFLFADSQAAYRVIDGAMGQEVARKLEGVGLVSLGWWDNGIRHITNSKRPINQPADLRGLKIRTPADPATIDTFQAAKLHEVNRFISLTSHKWECSPFVASRIAWGRLNEADRRLVAEVGREATEHNRRLMGESDAKLLAEYRASPAVSVNEAEQALFRAATVPVLDRWEQRPVGDFAKRLRAAAAAAAAAGGGGGQ